MYIVHNLHSIEVLCNNVLVFIISNTNKKSDAVAPTLSDRITSNIHICFTHFLFLSPSSNRQVINTMISPFLFKKIGQEK